MDIVNDHVLENVWSRIQDTVPLSCVMHQIHNLFELTCEIPEGVN
jgi:acyl carrier protein phosphodiesterase